MRAPAGCFCTPANSRVVATTKKGRGKVKAVKDEEAEKSEPAAPVTKRGRSAKAKAGEDTKPANSVTKKPATKKRKELTKSVDGEDEAGEEDAPAAKKPRVIAAPKKIKPVPVAKVKIGKAINKAPTQRLDVYVFGEGTSGELGLGSVAVDGKKPIDVKRPRLNEKLSAEKVGVVQITAGGMHCAALTAENTILTWGVNDQGALGRDTKWEGGLRNMDDDKSSGSDSDEEDLAMNPLESTPMAVGSEHFPEGIKFVQVVASDSATFVLTEDGMVYGWGTFRVSR